MPINDCNREVETTSTSFCEDGEQRDLHPRPEGKQRDLADLLPLLDRYDRGRGGISVIWQVRPPLSLRDTAEVGTGARRKHRVKESDAR